MPVRIMLVEHEMDTLLSVAQKCAMKLDSAWVKRDVFVAELGREPEVAPALTPDNQEDLDVEIVAVTEPDEIRRNMDESIDLVVTDLLFFHPNVPPHSPTAYVGDFLQDLNTVLSTIEEAEMTLKFKGRSFPVVAWTSLTESGSIDQLKEVLPRLYDVWEKSSSADTIMWRASKVSHRLRSQRPGTSLARYISGLTVDIPWHERVMTLASRYMRAGTPQQQVADAENPIADIARQVGIPGAGIEMWKAFTHWEPIGTSAGIAGRAHARHAINVYWLGYWLLNSPDLKSFRVTVAQQIRRELEELEDLAPDAQLANEGWFLAGVFHDVGIAVCEIARLLDKQSKALKNVTPEFTKSVISSAKGLSKATKEKIADAFASAFPDFLDQVSGNELDHGIAGGAMMMSKILEKDGKVKDKRLCAIVRASSRAIMVHNLVFEKPEKCHVKWNEQPLACLLVMCDQLQAWEREYDVTINDEKKTVRVRSAELTKLHVGASAGRAKIEISVDYLVPEELRGNWQQVLQLEDDLTQVLLQYPIRVIQDQLRGDIPFDMDVNFTMGGRPLECRLALPSRRPVSGGS